MLYSHRGTVFCSLRIRSRGLRRVDARVCEQSHAISPMPKVRAYTTHADSWHAVARRKYTLSPVSCEQVTIKVRAPYYRHLIELAIESHFLHRRVKNFSNDERSESTGSR